MSNNDLFIFTFKGYQDSNPFLLRMVARSEVDARERALNAVAVAARQSLLKELKSHHQMLDAIPYPTQPSDPVDDYTGNYCANINMFFSPIFDRPSSKDQLNIHNWNKGKCPCLDDDHDYNLIPFDVWIKNAAYTQEVFNPYKIQIYSCLDG